MSFVLLALIAIPIGWVASMIGVGGGIFMVPLLTLLYVPTTQIAVGTSLAAIVFNSLSSTFSYARQRVIQLSLAMMILPGAAVGAWLGAYLTDFISSGMLALAFGVVMLYSAGIMLWGKAPKDLAAKFQKKSEDGNSRPHWLFVLIVGLLAGLASGFFGIGGGIVMVPAMTILLGVDIVPAVATSLFVMGPISLVGVAQHAFLGNVRLEFAAPLAIGIVIGAQLGAYTTTRVPQLFLRRLFGIVLLYSAINMILKGLTPPPS
ncbi:sulfite exporter TauE/SafE family protein [Candidatus Acetothermia bacterium]|nr:sulfite exporter TauE/SafE family protein [Candidatus Acetothermia bacterium]MBI3643763.1 sulfite exporter TauE/SafE family protein [Candidatus Acetothermia bacterium]